MEGWQPQLFGLVNNADAGSIQLLFYTISEMFFTQVQSDKLTFLPTKWNEVYDSYYEVL